MAVSSSTFRATMTSARVEVLKVLRGGDSDGGSWNMPGMILGKTSLVGRVSFVERSPVGMRWSMGRVIVVGSDTVSGTS